MIDIGFAFAAYDSVNVDQSNPPISEIWLRAFQYLVSRTVDKSVLVVCPAGNQGSDAAPRFPGALWTKDPVFKNVVAVGSIDPVADAAVGDPPAVPVRSCFSNYGSWVTCSAIGRDVQSTFLKVDMPLEGTGDAPGGCPPNDSDGTPQDFTGNGWAIWSGTSFAAPKVVGGVCKAMHISGKDSAGAMHDVLGVPFPLAAPASLATVGPGVGVMLPNL